MFKALRSASEQAARAVLEFVRLEAAAGLLLMAAAVLALIAANSDAAPWYEAFRALPLGFESDGFALRKPLLLWINDGLMALFFLLVALEIKRERLQGELANPRHVALPVVAAIGGMAAPALIFILINLASPETMRGWAIPAATDIAFALGVLTLLGPRVPLALKVLLTTIAVVDDLGAILIIALFYTSSLAIMPLLLALAALAVLIAMNRLGVQRLLPYLAVGAVLWLCVLKSGVHATLAGVALGLTIPMQGAGGSPLIRLEHALHPFVAFAIVPLFAFANAGLDLSGMNLSSLLAPLPLGIALGLVLGKPLGVYGVAAGLIRLGLLHLPPGVSHGQLLAMAIIAGIGFTMSLFIGTLAFADPAMQDQVRLGVLAGSVTAAILGGGLLFAATRPQPAGQG